MTDYDQASKSDSAEIDLVELFATVKPSLPLALVFGALCSGAALFYAQNLEKIYTTTAKFVIKGGSGGRIPDVSAFVPGFSGVDGGNREGALVTDKIMSRDFIDSLIEKTDLGIEDDPYFTGEGDRPDPMTFVFGEREVTSEQEREAIVNAYRNKIVGVETSRTSGVVNLRVRHPDPVRAARIANTIMETHIDNIETKRIEDDQRQVDLMKGRLTRAQLDLEKALDAARLYALENNLRSEEELGASSLNLTQFRRQVERLNAILAGIGYIEERRVVTPSGSMNLNDFFAKHPVAFTPLQRDLRWDADQGVVPLPPLGELASLRQSFIDEREQLQRTLRIMENEAAQNADAAGQLSQLQRNIEVQKTVYTTLVSRTEARSLSAALQGESVERIQWAPPPLRPSSPRVLLWALVAFVAGTLLTFIIGLARSWRAGTLYTANSITRLLPAATPVTTLKRTVNTRLSPIKAIEQRLRRTDDAELFDLAAILQENDIRRLSIIGAPSLPASHNLATMLGGIMAEGGERIAVVSLARRDKGGGKIMGQNWGLLVKTETTENLTILRWIAGTDAESMTLEEALAQANETFDRTITVCAPLEWGVLRNRVALAQADHVLLVTRKGKTTKHDVKWADRLISQVPGIGHSLVLT